MKRYLLLTLAGYMLLVMAPLAAQQPDFASPIAECQNSSDLDTCLGDLAYLAGDASICTSASNPTHCRQTMADSVELICQDQSDPQSCFGEWGAQGVESACTYLPAENQAECFLVAASESRDYDIIDRRFPEGEERDQANARVAILAAEPALLAEIDDNQTYDSAYVYMISILGFRQNLTLADDYCAGLRANWGGEYPNDAQVNADVCERGLALVRAWQEAEESERDAILEDMIEALEEGGEEAAITVLLDRLVSDPLEEAFVRGWCRADDTGVNCTEAAIPIMEYDAETDIIVQFSRNGPPRFYRSFGDGIYRMYYDAEITNSDGEMEIVRWYGEIVIESPERFYWQFYNHLDRAIGTENIFIPLPAEAPEVD